MMLPALACCPPKSLIPKRLLSDSRPFLELPTPFLCAISLCLVVVKWLSDDLFDAHFGKLLAVSVQLAVALSSLLVEDEHLIALNQRRKHFADHLGTFHRGRAHLHTAIGIDQQHLVELHRCAALDVTEVMDKQLLPLLGLKLLAVDFYNYVN